MAKYSFEPKCIAVKEYLEGEESFRGLGTRFGIYQKAIERWVALYKTHGEEGLIPRLSYSNYSVEFKMDGLNYMNKTGSSLLQKLLLKFNIPATINQWKKVLEEQGLDALQSKKRGHPSMKKEPKKNQPVEDGSIDALLADNERLRMEVVYLKKLNTVVQEKERLQNKTKRK